MKPFRPHESDFKEAMVDGKRRKVLSRTRFDAFNAWLLGLGDLGRAASTLDAVAAVFELGGFEDFSRHVESDTAIPLTLKEFLIWLTEQIKAETKRKEHDGGVVLWGPLPFFVKFTGEGMLVLWDMSAETDVIRRNVLATALAICTNYKKDFLPRLFGRVADPPPALRCALARSTVYSLGEGHDYAGACIVMAQRLHRLQGITYCFDSRGFYLKDADENDWIKKDIVVKRVSQRGIGENELIGILRTEAKRLSLGERRQFRSL